MNFRRHFCRSGSVIIRRLLIEERSVGRTLRVSAEMRRYMGEHCGGLGGASQPMELLCATWRAVAGLSAAVLGNR